MVDVIAVAGLGTREAGGGAPPEVEPVVKFESSPGRVKLELSDVDALFDSTDTPSFPHSGPMVNKSVAKFLVDSARENRSMETVEVAITFEARPSRLPTREGSDRR